MTSHVALTAYRYGSNRARAILATLAVALFPIAASALAFRVTLPAQSERETPVSFQVTAIDDTGATITSYTGTVHFRGTSGISFPADYTYTPADNGTHTFIATFHVAGYAVITAEDAADPTTGRSGTTLVVCSDYHATATNDGPACPGVRVALHGTSDHSGVSYYWSGPHGWFSFDQNPMSPGVDGTYYLTVNDPSNGCAAYATTTVTSRNAVKPIIESDHCAYAGSSLVATIINGAYPNPVWSINGSANIVSGQGTSSITVSVPQSTTSFEIVVSATDPSTGCPVSGTASMYSQQPGAILTTGALCPHGIGEAETANPIGTITWTISNGTILGDTHQRRVRYSAGDSGTVTLTATHLEPDPGCRRVDTTSIQILQGQAPEIRQQPRDAVVLSGGTATLTVAAAGTQLGYDWYQGLSGDTSKLVFSGSSSFTTPPLSKSTSYWVRVHDGANCGGDADSQTAKVTVVATRRRAAGR